MANLLEYKGCHGKIDYSAEDEVLYGEIVLINDLVTFEADNVADLKKTFEETVDHYLEISEKIGREPQKAFRGKFNVRIRPELHRIASLVALKSNISLNKLVAAADLSDFQVKILFSDHGEL